MSWDQPTLGIRLSQPTHCRAVKDQLTVYDWEDELYERARRNRRMVAWWHGYRMTPVAFGDVCYICNRTVATWSRRWPITRKAQRLIETHKMFHRAEMVSPGSTNEKGQ